MGATIGESHSGLSSARERKENRRREQRRRAPAEPHLQLVNKGFCTLTPWFFLPLFLTGESDGEEQRIPSSWDYFLHFLCFFWKVLFACIPPTEYWSGWACFAISVVGIGFLTAVIGDLASHFGCTVGLRDSVTALVFVALGTSLPGRCFP